MIQLRGVSAYAGKGSLVPVRWRPSSVSTGCCAPINLFNRPITVPGTEMPSQGVNVGASRERLPLTRGTGQHWGLLQAPPFQAGVADAMSGSFQSTSRRRGNHRPCAPVEWALCGPIAASYRRTCARPLASPFSCNYNKRRGGGQYGLILLPSPGESAAESAAALTSQHRYAALALGVCDLIVMGQPVANAGHGKDILRRAGVRLDLLTQPPHVDPQEVRRVVIGWPPHPFEQLLM